MATVLKAGVDDLRCLVKSVTHMLQNAPNYGSTSYDLSHAFYVPLEAD